jgi:hypothetical protein
MQEEEFPTTLPPLMFVMKTLLRERNLHSPANGHLGGYALLNMVHTQPPTLNTHAPSILFLLGPSLGVATIPLYLVRSSLLPQTTDGRSKVTPKGNPTPPSLHHGSQFRAISQAGNLPHPHSPIYTHRWWRTCGNKSCTASRRT